VYYSPLSFVDLWSFRSQSHCGDYRSLSLEKQHISFISAHIGILILLAGSLITRYYGVDGSMSIEMGGKENKITVPETELKVFTL